MKFSLIVLITLVTLVNSETVKICGNPSYPPFHWEENKKIVGVGPTVITKIFDELGIKVDNNFDGNWARCQKDIKSGYRDMFTAGYKTIEREKYTIYTSMPLMQDSQIILVKKGQEFKFQELNDLIGKVGGHILGSKLGKDIDKFLKENIDMHYVTSRAQIFRMLDLGRIDFEIVGLWSAKIQMKRYNYENKLSILNKPVSTENLYMAISKKSKYLKFIDYINLRLQQMHDDGSIDKIMDNHIRDIYQ